MYNVHVHDNNNGTHSIEYVHKRLRELHIIVAAYNMATSLPQNVLSEFSKYMTKCMYAIPKKYISIVL